MSFNHTPIRVAILALLLNVAAVASLHAQPFDYNSISIKAETQPHSIPAGDLGVIIVTLGVPFGHTLTDSEATFEMIPEETAGFTFGELRKPQPDHTDEAGGHWGGVVEFRIPFSVAADAPPGAREIGIALKLQVCDETSGLCYRPTRMKTSAKLEVTPAAAVAEQKPAAVEAGAQPAAEEPGKEPASEETTTAASGGVIETEARAEGAPLEESLKNWLEEALSGGQIWLALVITFLAGILTSLTPCVYPMIPITIAYVSGRAEGKKMNGFMISLALVLGIVITYTALGVFAALAGATFGSIGRNLIVQAVILIVLVAMGFSMLGAFEIGLPASMQQKMQVQRKGYIGALLVGLTIGFAAAPCVAPVLIPILALIATSGNLIMGVVLMASYAIGMGLLFILVGTFSNLILPKSGQWMVELKKVFAFILFLVAIFFARDLIEAIPIPRIFEITLGALLVLFGTVIGAFHRLERDSGWWQVLGKAAGILLVTTGLIYFAYGFLAPMLPSLTVGTTAKASPAWMHELDEGLALADRQRKPAVIDFWADWCAACLELDQYTWSDPRIMTELKRFVTIKIDGSDESDPTYQEARGRYGVQALPRVVLRDSSGGIAKVFDGFRDAETVLGYLRSTK
jgi:thiol:disulfide interchange protein DsbD